MATVGALAPAALRAQATAPNEPATMPTPFVHALLGGSTSSSARISVGALPPGWPAELVPAAATILGGAWTHGPMSAWFVDSAPQPLARYQALLATRGFTRPAPREAFGFQPGGSPYDFYCRDSARVSASMVHPPAGPLVLHVELQPVKGRFDPCATSAAPRHVDDGDVLKLPPLTPPAGAEELPGTAGAGSDRVTADTRLVDPARSPGAVASHYAAQLAAAGWTTGTTVADSSVAAVALDASDKGGRHWHGTLVVRRTGRNHEVELTMKPEER